MNFTDELLKFKNSENTAVVFGDEKIRYRDLIRRALCIAFYFSENNTDRVIIKTARSANAVVAALGVIFSGGIFAFLPENTAKENIESAVSDFGGAFIIDDNTDFSSLPPAPKEFSPKSINESDPVCAVFTSGSTGKPKGALLTYRALCNTVSWQTDYMKLPENSHTASYASFSFIAAFWEIWYPLTNGFTLYILKDETRVDVFALSEFINKNAIAYAFLPSDVAEIFSGVYGGGSLRFLRVAGGRLSSCKKPVGYEILYSLGMAENAGSVTFLPINCEMSGNIPIGKPFADTEIYLIDGEMAVSGPSLFVGYIGQKELTDKVLINNPNANGRPIYSKMYMSGDLARISDDGNLIHCGRRDWIVKINNVKTNPLDSERVILEIDGIFEAAVIPFSRGESDIYLTCFYSGNIKPETIPELLKNKLPSTSIPSYFIKLDSLPKNSNGKIDRKKLTMPEFEKKEEDFVSETEKAVAAAFEKILGLKGGFVGRNDSFISLGGSSLGLMKLQAEIAVVLGMPLKFSEISAAQTPAAISKLSISTSTIPKTKLQLNTPYPLTAPERQMWLLHRTGQDNGRYSVRIRCDFDGEINLEKARNAFQKLSDKNPVISSYYHEIDGVPYHFYTDEKIRFTDREPKTFNLNNPPLFAATLNKNSLVFTAHHIIVDASAMRVLVEDFWNLYMDKEPLQAALIHDIETFESRCDYSENEAFWKKCFSDYSYEALPTENTENKASQYVISFSENEVTGLCDYIKERNITLFSAFTAAAGKLISLIQKTEKPVIGLPFSGRENPETIRTVGMLVRTLPIRFCTNGDFETVLCEFKSVFEKAYIHQNYPFELINEKFGVRYDVMVNFIPLPEKLTNADNLNPRIIRGTYPSPPTPLVIDLREEDNGFSAVFTYDSLSDKTIQNWAENFKAILLCETVGDIIIPSNNKTESNENSDIQPEFSEIWKEFFGSDSGNFYELGGTSLKAIRIEEALLSRGLYLSAADILGIGDYNRLSALITPADEIDWEAE
jgi:non-ribosomal peptide synthetase component F